MAELVPYTCNLNEGGSVVVEVPDPTAGDHDETWMWFEILTAAVGA